MSENSSKGCCCCLPSFVGVGLMGAFNLLVLLWGVYLLFTSGPEASGFVLISGMCLAPFVWVCLDHHSVTARLVLYILTIIAWIAFIVIGTFLMLVIIGLTQPGPGKDEMWWYFWPTLAVLIILGVVFIDSAKNFYYEKRDEHNSATKPLLE